MTGDVAGTSGGDRASVVERRDDERTADRPTPQDRPVVEVRGVTRTFGDVTALSDVSLDVAAGSFVSLIGPSGCGKSTLLRVIADLLEPSTGEVTVAGRTAREARERREYGMVFQKATLFDWRTVRRNVELPLELMGWDRARRRERADEMLELVELTDFARHRPNQLSGGMQQRVSIARALAFQPKLLLMDEPFGALDEITRERLNLELLGIWSRTGTTIVFVTHSIPEAVFLSTDIVVMSPRPGRILTHVPVDLPRPRSQDTRELDEYFRLVTQVRETLRGAGLL